jgi:coenzyme PQQ precursor peptide PqqA
MKSGGSQPIQKGGTVMSWEAPSFVEVKMDAEINAYQDDFGEIPDVQERPTEALVATNPQ